MPVSEICAPNVPIFLAAGLGLRHRAKRRQPGEEIGLMHEYSDPLTDRIREELGRRRATRQWLAHEARISLSTLEKGLAGQRRFTTATLVRIESALGVALRARGRDQEDKGSGIAPAELGAYARPAVRWLEGEYLTVRPSFGVDQALCAYLTTILWDEEEAHLVFRESERVDAAYSQHGDVALPHQSGHIHLITRENGQFRLATLNHPTIAGALCGILATLQAGGGARLLPVACPLALIPLRTRTGARFGLSRPGEAGHEALTALLGSVEAEGFARLVGSPAAAFA
jgi:hypothetical protein